MAVFATCSSTRRTTETPDVTSDHVVLRPRAGSIPTRTSRNTNTVLPWGWEDERKNEESERSARGLDLGHRVRAGRRCVGCRELRVEDAFQNIRGVVDVLSRERARPVEERARNLSNVARDLRRHA